MLSSLVKPVSQINPLTGACRRHDEIINSFEFIIRAVPLEMPPSLTIIALHVREMISRTILRTGSLASNLIAK